MNGYNELIYATPRSQINWFDYNIFLTKETSFWLTITDK